MDAVVNPRAIVHRKQLAADLDALAQRRDLQPAELRAGVLARLKHAHEDGEGEVRRRFEADNDGRACVAQRCFLIDQLVRAIHDFVTSHVHRVANPTQAERMAIVAVGGYGRGELAPHSDIDLLFLRPYKQTPLGEQIVEDMLYLLWDMGLKVGHATRSVEECLRQARADVTIRTALLECRYIWGEQSLYTELRRRFLKEIVAGSAPEFVEAKLAEAAKRHVKLGDSRYLVEPNIKEGKGGLRDLHTLFWIAKYVYRTDSADELVVKSVLSRAEARRFAKAQEFLWCLRCHLHYLADRAEERLTFDVQQEIGRRMGYTDHTGTRGVERFMKHYYLVAKDVGDLTRIFCAAIESENKRRPLIRLPRLGLGRRKLEGFVIDAGRLSVASDEDFRKDRVNFIRLFETAQRHELDIHPHALRLITHDIHLIDARLRAHPEANRLFLAILAAEKNSEKTLRRMNEAGVFGRFLPDFGRVVAQMQFDMYHVYTVDEHTIFALGILHRIEQGELKEDHPLSTEVIHKVQSRHALYVALLLHDIAKGRGGDHSEIGAAIARKVGPRFGLSEEETETAAWLVLHHLLMSNTAFKRDINDSKTIADFVKLVQSPERLRLLLILTVADIRAVGPNVWNNWKAALLRELYYRAEEMLSGTVVAGAREKRIAAAQAALRAALPDWSEDDFAAHVQRGYASYWLTLDTGTQARHARLVRQATSEGAPLAIDRRVDAARAVTEITIYTADHPGLFARLTGAIAVAGASIVDAKIFTLANGMALDTFWIQGADGRAFERPDRLAKLTVLIEQSLAGRLRPVQELAKAKGWPSRTRTMGVPPRVFIDNTASATHTVIEINGRDRPGLLYQLARTLTALNLQISTAKISTYGEQVVDVFYVKDVFGLKVEHDAKLAQIRDQLMAALADPAAAAEVPASPVRRPARRVERRRQARPAAAE
jgi:[protein-PII] uridylyltransferase